MHSANFCQFYFAISARHQYSKICFPIIGSQLYLMGNAIDKITEHKYEVSLGALGVLAASLLYYQRSEIMQLRAFAHQIDPQIPVVSKLSLKSTQISEESITDEYIKYKQNPIYRVVLTGGPCAGKSTCITKIHQHFRKKGFHVMVVPEVPTIIANGNGMSDFPKYGSQERMIFQMDLIKFKIYFEDYIAKLADMGKAPTLILCDRGLVDCAAYMSKEEYQALLDDQGWTWSQLRDKRYDSVIFLNTAAKGAEEFYTLANNSARTETPQQARALDDKTLAAWVGHPYMTIVPNVKGKPFAYKVDLVIKAIQKTIGLESTEVFYHKYLVELDQFPEDLQVITSEIEQIFLNNKNKRYVQDKIKKRGQDNSYTYQRKFVGPYDPEMPFREVVRVSLNSLQYATLAKQESDPYFRPIHMKRNNFTWNNVYFSIDEIDNIKNYKNAKLLRFETRYDRDAEELIPPWIKIIQNVNKNKDFNLSKIAYRQY